MVAAAKESCYAQLTAQPQSLEPGQSPPPTCVAAVAMALEYFLGLPIQGRAAVWKGASTLPEDSAPGTRLVWVSRALQAATVHLRGSEARRGLSSSPHS